MTALHRGKRKRIHVNGSLIREAQTGRKAVKPIVIQCGSKSYHCADVTVHGPSRLVYRPDRPLRSGAVVWVETRGDVTGE